MCMEKYSLVQEVSQEDCLGYHTDDRELMVQIQERSVAEPGELLFSTNLYPQNPFHYGSLLSGVAFKGTYVPFYL